MWVVAKYKSREFNYFKHSLSQTLADIDIFRPVYFNGKLITPLLGVYCFIHHQEFQKDDIINKLKYRKGVNSILNNYKTQQPDIISFIDYLKQYQDDKGHIQPDFFYQYLRKKGIFLEGHFKSMIFNILQQNKKIFKVSIEGSNITFNFNKEKTKVNFL